MAAQQVDREWVGGRFTLSAPAGGKPAEVVLWVELPELAIVGQTVDQLESRAVSFTQSLTRAMSAPLVGEARRPTRVRVADAALADELRGLSSLEVVTAATPELDAVRRSIEAFLGEGSYFSDPALRADDLASFFAAARELWEARPWTLIDDDCLLQVDIPALGVAAGCVSVVGTMGDVRGFVLFPSIDDHARMIEDADEFERDGAPPEHSALYLSFDPADAVPEPMRAEVEKHAWPLGRERLYPVLLRMEDGREAPIFKVHVQVVRAVASAVAACVLKNRGAFAEFGSIELRESYTDGAQVETTLTVPHPELPEVDSELPRAPTTSEENPYALPLAPESLGALERALGPFTLHRAIGMFCAVASAPKLISPNVWLSEVAEGARFANEAAFRKVAEPLTATYNHVLERVESGELDSLVPEEDDSEACQAWARGYTSILRQLDPATFGEDIVESVLSIRALAEEPGTLEILEEHCAKQGISREQLLADCREALADHAVFLWESWEGQRAEQDEPSTFRRTSAKVGRNDPCPCGSGKKYKKCCEKQ